MSLMPEKVKGDLVSVALREGEEILRSTPAPTSFNPANVVICR